MSPDVERGQDLARVENFSDGVFAIAITVLVLTIQIPHVDDARISDAVDRLAPQVAVYFLSFVVVAFYWLAHHRMWHFIRRIDGTFLVLNLVLLSFVSLAAFPTDLLGDNGSTIGATVLYASAAVATGLASTALWWYSSTGHRLIRPEVPEDFIRRMLMRAAAVPIVFGLSIPLAFLDPGLAKLFWLTLLPLRILLARGYGSVYEI